MLLFKTVADLQIHIAQQKQNGHTIGFVPTMGALHQGHLSLMKQSINENEITICSIFVNPTQFNDSEDLQKYPRTIEKDIELLTLTGVDILFLPEVDEVYPKNWQTPSFDFQGLDELMEGEHRPGHFAGVAEVVYRLLDIVKPTTLYMGQKDYQQWRIIQSMLTQLNSNIRLKRCAIEREIDGLAMSSRNVRLPEEARMIAPNINKILELARQDIVTLSIQEVIFNARKRLNEVTNFTLDYFEIVDGQTLKRVENKDSTTSLVACTAVYLANIRLIDNIILR